MMPGSVGQPAGRVGDRETVGAVGPCNEYVLTKDFSGEQERLSLLEATVDAFSVAAIRAAGFSRGLRCLEIGAGSGSIARWFAQEAGDPTVVTATDIDPRLLQPLADEGIHVLEHDVVGDDFPLTPFMSSTLGPSLST
jgi:SAM-dependent methyltransferase